MVAQPGTQSSRYPLNSQAMARSPDGAKKRSKSSPQRGSSRSPRRDLPEIPKDDFDKNSEHSSTHSWSEGPPGQDCTLGDLRWFVVREIGNLKRSVTTVERDTERNVLQHDVIKTKIKGKLDMDQVNARVAKALEFVPHLVDYESFKQKITEDIDAAMKAMEERAGAQGSHRIRRREP